MATLKRVNVIIILMILLILLFTSSKGYFFADDFSHLLQTKYVNSKEMATVFTKPDYAWHYRPLVRVFFLLNYSASGLNPTSYFMTDIVFFLLNIYAFFLFVQAISKNSLQAHGAVLLLLLQVNTYLYTVNWICAGCNMMASFFVIALVFFYIKSVSSTPFGKFSYLMSNLCFGLSLLVKESAVILPVILSAYDLLFVWLDAPKKARALGQMILRYIPFGGIFVVYILIRNASGAPALTESGYYTLTLGSHILRNSLFWGMQLGFLAGAVLLLSLPSLFVDRLRLEKNDFKVILFGLFMALAPILPVLFIPWTSPTWLFLPAIGTTLAISVLFRKVFDEGAKKRARLVLYGAIVSAILGSALLFWRLSEARWLQWGTYTKNVLLEVERHYPDLPHGATIYFIDKNEGKDYGIDRLFRGRHHLGSALRLWYDDLSLEAYIVGDINDLEKQEKERATGEHEVFVFEYYDGHVTDKTNAFR